MAFWHFGIMCGVPCNETLKHRGLKWQIFKIIFKFQNCTIGPKKLKKEKKYSFLHC